MENILMKLFSMFAFVALVIFLLFPYRESIIKILGISKDETNLTSVLDYKLPRNLAKIEKLNSPPALSVPILMYHGVVVVGGDIGTNTTRKNFISQMEMLKKEGFETISVSDFNSFLKGEFVLPSRPVIITFDDGRKDSYYTVDKVLEKLGFKATIFIASIKANQNDPFYLSWKELETLRDSGRWEIEAHGRNSHEEVIVDKDGTTGRFYTSRIFSSQGQLESLSDYKKRVENDYIFGINDIKDNLKITPKYFAIPLSDFGSHDDSNYPEALEFNRGLTKKYFELAFTQANPIDSFYNFKDSNRYELKRLEVKNISAKELLKELQKVSQKESL
jgi:hypothetical protein